MKYFVFRRNDGHVGSIAAETQLVGEHHLSSYSAAGKTISFEILLSTFDWDEAREMIHVERERLKRENANDASE